MSDAGVQVASLELRDTYSEIDGSQRQQEANNTE